jgi:hypothetical protein
MSFDPNQEDVDRQVDASMKMFERAKVGKVPALEPTPLSTVLLCLDGSDQDAASIAAGRHLAEQFSGCRILILDAREASATSSESQTAASIPGDWTRVSATADAAYDKILATIAAEQPDMIVVPCPFGRDFESVGVDSAGTVIDVLLNRSPVPMLVIRRADHRTDVACKTIDLIVASENESEPAAASMAVALLATGGKLTLNLVMSDEQVENVRELLNVIAPDAHVDREKLESALAVSHARLDAALRHTADKLDINYRMEPRVQTEHAGNNASAHLIVLPLEHDDRFGQGFVQDQIRHSANPVLVVPGKGKRGE